jgi:DNA polymerase III sliding clamp (beta) subunit (PCNA family)
MKIIVNRKSFRRALSNVGGHRLNKSTEWLCLTPHAGSLVLEDNTPECAIKTQIPARCEAAPKAFLQKKSLARIVSSIKSQELSMELTEESLQITGGKATFNIKLQNPKEYPRFTDFGTTPQDIHIAPELFRKAIRSTIFATRRFTNSYSILQCVNIRVSNNSLVFQATDGARISTYKIALGNTDEDTEMSIMVKPQLLDYLRRSTTDATVKLSMKQNNHLVLALSDRTQAAVPILEGTYPSLTDVIESQNHVVDQAVSLSLRGSQLNSLISQAAIVSTRDHQLLHLYTDGDQLCAEMQTPEVGYASSTLKLETKYPKAGVTIDCMLLKDALTALGHREKFQLTLFDKTKPIRLSTERWEYVLMTFADGTQQRHSYDGGFGYYQPHLQRSVSQD